jgi:hypothetical protein
MDVVGKSQAAPAEGQKLEPAIKILKGPILEVPTDGFVGWHLICPTSLQIYRTDG